MDNLRHPPLPHAVPSAASFRFASRLQSVTKEGLTFGDEDAADVKKREKYYKNVFKPLTDSLKDTFKGKITKVGTCS